MEVRYVVQPTEQIGVVVSRLLEEDPTPTKVVMVSAFATKQTMVRYRIPIEKACLDGAEVKVVLGIDLQGTTIEALLEVLGWSSAESCVVKNAKPGHTFHPKIYWVERNDRLDLLVGSSNATEGGFFTNYEVTVHLKYRLPADTEMVEEARQQLTRFLDPQGNTCQVLTTELIKVLTDRKEIITESQRRSRRSETRRSAPTGAGVPESPFGMEIIVPPPPLSKELLTQVIKSARKGRTTVQIVPPEKQLSPLAFYMHLPKMRSDADAKRKMPGEARTPIAARDIAPSFWSWPEMYSVLVGDRKSKKYGDKKEKRVYHEWKPKWRIASADAPDQWQVDDVRMYLCESNSDFRFYSPRLVEIGADAGDIVMITQSDEPGIAYDCVLARKGTDRFNEWNAYCVEEVRNGKGRRFGYV